VTARKLKRLFDYYHRRYFNGELPDYRIHFLRLRATCGVTVTMRISVLDATTHSNRNPLQSAQPRNGSISMGFKIGNLQTCPVGSTTMYM
jgi:hypothetical protein